MGYVSLILEERKVDTDLQQKLGMVLDAAKQAASSLPITGKFQPILEKDGPILDSAGAI
jgi:hypothetical protein